MLSQMLETNRRRAAIAAFRVGNAAVRRAAIEAYITEGRDFLRATLESSEAAKEKAHPRLRGLMRS